jgi:ribonuclease P protein component
MTGTEKHNTRYTFGKKEHLKSRNTIQALFTQNKSIRIYPFKLVWMITETDQKSEVKAGVSVSKRNHRSAVKRNFIKRRMRECYRINKELLYKHLPGKNIEVSFMLLYTANDIVPFSEFETKIKQLINRLGEKLKTNDFL